MLEYWWMASNETGRNDSDAAIEKMLQDPGSTILFAGYPRWMLYFAAVCCVLFMLVGIPGNLITVVALFRTKKLRNATAVFIMNLSISDLMFCCFDLPLAASTFWHSSWLHGPLLCRLFPLLRYGLVAVSLFTVLAITINRYVMIGHPGLYPALYKTRHLIPMVLATWIVAFGTLIVTWYGRWGRFGLDPAIGSCSILPDANGRSPKEFLFVLAFLIPCVAIVVCYARIFYIVRRTATKSRARDKISVEPAETSHEQRSISTRNQEEGEEEEELSVLCMSSSPTPASLLRPDKEIDPDGPPSRSPDSSCCKRPVCDQRETVPRDPATRAAGDVRLDLARLGDDSRDNVRASPTAVAKEDSPFADETDFAETKRFLNSWQLGSSETQRGPSNGSRREPPDGTTRRASFVARSTPWTHVDIATDDRSARIPAESKCPERSPAKRRESKFRGVGIRKRVPGAEPAPRMSAKDRKLLQMILVIFLSFLVCYLPITVTKLFRAAVDWRGLNIAGYVLIYLTTCINPVIYVVMSSEYRSAYKHALLCRRERTAGKGRSPGLLTPG